MANNVDPDEMAHYEPSHQVLHYLQKKKKKKKKKKKQQHWSAGLKGFKTICRQLKSTDMQFGL